VAERVPVLGKKSFAYVRITLKELLLIRTINKSEIEVPGMPGCLFETVKVIPGLILVQADMPEMTYFKTQEVNVHCRLIEPPQVAFNADIFGAVGIGIVCEKRAAPAAANLQEP